MSKEKQHRGIINQNIHAKLLVAEAVGLPRNGCHPLIHHRARTGEN